MTDQLPIGEPIIPASHVPVDEIGRPVITDQQKQQVTAVTSMLDPDAKAALLIFTDMQVTHPELTLNGIGNNGICDVVKGADLE